MAIRHIFEVPDEGGVMLARVFVAAEDHDTLRARVATLEAAIDAALNALLAGPGVSPAMAGKAISMLRSAGASWHRAATATQEGSATDGE